MPEPFTVANVEIPGPLFLIAGPCVIESEQHALKMAESIAGVCRALGMPYIFKASYDKANRTSIRSFRGPGIDEGARILRKVRDTVGVPVLTDVHDHHDVERIAESVDVLQIPAFLCRQTDLLVAAGKSGKVVNIKKGQFVSPWDMRHAVQKVRDSGNDRIFLTERGTTFGYGNLVVDMRSLAIMREFAPVVFDATHSVQLPSASVVQAPSSAASDVKGGDNAVAVSGGQPEFIPLLSRAAVAAGIDGIFMEVHDDPAHAKSDGANSLPLPRLRETLVRLIAIRNASRD
jgi:2-dehydro-3-deoxyphosphooctonate aldolase (KDO 8-P synthase)